MTDLKALVDVLRDGTPIAEPAAGLDGLDRLADQVRDAGLEVSLTEFGERADGAGAGRHRGLPGGAGVADQHGPARRRRAGSRCSCATRRPRWSVDVQDDGHGAATVVDGHGIAGMRERVAALGGALTAGASRDRIRGTRDDPDRGLTMTISVLLADDQHLVRAGFRSLLRRDKDIVVVGEVSTGDEAVRTARAAAARRDPDGHPDARPGRHRGDPADRRRPGPAGQPGRSS